LTLQLGFTEWTRMMVLGCFVQDQIQTLTKRNLTGSKTVCFNQRCPKRYFAVGYVIPFVVPFDVPLYKD